jgi:2-polyprenyl-3-methyl-5-hydroxy-6-metoxy-1,4-benzoquinol methylase
MSESGLQHHARGGTQARVTGMPAPETCNLCGGKDLREWYVASGRSLLVCAACGLRTLSPLPEPKELASLYTAGEYFDTPYFTVDDERAGTAHYRHFRDVASLFEHACGREGRVLEVGPGRGTFLRMCLDRSIKAEGLDPSARIVEALESTLGCPVRRGFLEEAAYEQGSFSAVAAFDVIEHCVDPSGWLREVNRILSPGGLLALSTVNVANLLDRLGKLLYRAGVRRPVERLYPPYHLYYYTPATLARYLDKEGFSVVTMEQENYDIRKATSNRLEQLALRLVYAMHDLMGNKTNIYVTARRR